MPAHAHQAEARVVGHYQALNVTVWAWDMGVQKLGWVSTFVVVLIQAFLDVRHDCYFSFSVQLTNSNLTP